MKINPIGINAYQQINRTGNTEQSANIGNKSDAVAHIKLQPQNPQLPSRVSIKPQSVDSISIMTASERNALEGLLKVVHEKSTMNAGYARDNRTVENPEAVGNFVDVKV